MGTKEDGSEKVYHFCGIITSSVAQALLYSTYTSALLALETMESAKAA